MTSPGQAIPVHAVVPAAGLSRRMGRPKQTLPYRGSTVLGTVIRTLLGTDLDTIVVVTRTELVGRLGLPDDARVSITINDDGASQMIDSLRVGLVALFGDSGCNAVDEPAVTDDAPPRAGVLVLPGDMPGVTFDTCRRCIEAFRRDPTRIIVAACGATRGHPVIFPATFRPHIDRHRAGLDSLLRTFADQTTTIDTADTATLKDLDTWPEYESDRPGGIDGIVNGEC